MIHSGKTVTMLLSIVALAAGLTACQKNEATADQGPAERAGKQLDQAAAKAGEQINKAAEEAGKGLAKVGEKLQQAAQDAQKKEDQKEGQ